LYFFDTKHTKRFSDYLYFDDDAWSFVTNLIDAKKQHQPASIVANIVYAINQFVAHFVRDGTMRAVKKYHHL
jgi:hypothetical protein